MYRQVKSKYIALLDSALYSLHELGKREQWVWSRSQWSWAERYLVDRKKDLLSDSLHLPRDSMTMIGLARGVSEWCPEDSDFLERCYDIEKFDEEHREILRAHQRPEQADL